MESAQELATKIAAGAPAKPSAPIDVDELRRLGESIAADPDAVDGLTEDQITNVRKHINPLGGVVKTAKMWANISLINWREKWLTRLIMTALVGYIFRLAEEYEPDFATEHAAFERETATLDKSSPDYARARDGHEMAFRDRTNAARATIRAFLQRHFDYNPDHHLRGAHTANAADPTRVSKEEGIRRTCETASRAEVVEPKIQRDPAKLYQYMRSKLLETAQLALDVKNTLSSAISVLSDPLNSTADKQGILLKKYVQISEVTKDISKITDPLAAADTIDAWRVDPPADVFFHFQRYLTNHYEQIRDICAALYHERPDFEYSVILYDAFTTKEAANDHKLQHKSEFRCDVVTVESGDVTLLGPFNENRKRIDFYNKNTQILEMMAKQNEQDQKLGKDIMEKRVHKAKKKNIAEAGPDDPELAGYSKAINQIQELGAKKVLSKDDIEALAKATEDAKRIKDNYEVPDGAIQTDIFHTKVGEDGVARMETTKMYTQAEAPLHLQKGSVYGERYQAKRPDGCAPEDDTRTVETIVDGQKVTTFVTGADYAASAGAVLPPP